MVTLAGCEFPQCQFFPASDTFWQWVPGGWSRFREVPCDHLKYSQERSLVARLITRSILTVASCIWALFLLEPHMAVGQR